MKIFNYLIVPIVVTICTANQMISAPPPLLNTDVKLFPDWSNFTFSDFEPIAEGGEVGLEADEAAGWSVSRTWQAGDSIDNVLKLGDLEESLSPQLFSLKDINQRILPTGTETEALTANPPATIDATLDEFGVVQNQTLETLVEAVPDLGLESAANVEPVADLLSQNGVGNLDVPIGDLVADSQIKDLPLDSLDLEQYSVDSIPGISEAQLEDFENYQDAYLSEIPGLSELPLSEFPNPVRAEVSFVGRIDFIWGDAEAKADRTISGSKVEGFNVPCESQCSHFELDDIENFGRATTSEFEGNQWIAGKNHWVKGGTGCFSGGKEPTGIHPFGDSSKSVLWSIDETADTGKIVTFFNIKTKCGDSAYFIGPFPFPQGNVKVNDRVYLGGGI